MTDPVLVLAWLVFAHLVADFVLQNDWIALNKGQGGRTGWAALLVHGGHVALCLLPAALAFGVPGVVYLALVAASHVVVDRWKVRATKRAEAQAQAAARRRLEAGGVPASSGLGSAWTPWPGMLFLADQALHATFAVVGWLVLLEGMELTPWFVTFADALFRDWDPATVHAVILTGVVLVSLFIVNTRGAYYFVLALVSPREIAPAAVPRVPNAAPAGAGAEAASTAAAPQGYTVRVGPLVATVEPTPPGSSEAGVGPPAGATGHREGSPLGAPEPVSPPAPPVAAPAASVPTGAPARIGATIGALERLLIVAFVLTANQAAIGFVVAAKTLARFKQLDDRGFAEYYLLGTLASVSVALATGLLGLAALSTLP